MKNSKNPNTFSSEEDSYYSAIFAAECAEEATYRKAVDEATEYYGPVGTPRNVRRVPSNWTGD